MKHLILPIFLAFIFLTSCTEDPLFEVNGRVIQEGSDIPVAGVELTFYSFQPSGEFFVPGSYKVIARIVTNEKGEYSLTYNEEFQTISIAASKVGYINCRNTTSCLPSFSREGKFEKDLMLKAEAYLTFDLIDTDTHSFQNSISLYPVYINNVVGSFFTSRDSLVTGTTESNRFHKYYYTMDGINTNVDSIYIEALSYDTVRIEF